MKTTLKGLCVALAAGATTLLVGGQAQAISLVPQGEGQVSLSNVDGGACFSGTCLDLNPLISSVESLTDATTGTQSLLFVDDLTTENYYDGTAIHFEAGDVGTNPSGYWFRPVEVSSIDSNGDRNYEENGQLEVGTFKFNFAKAIEKLTIAYFDTESNNTTGVFGGVLGTDGLLVNGDNPIPSGSNSNIKYQTWSNVTYITLKLGKDTNGTGDGVDFQMSVPEPTSMASFALVGIAGGLGALRKRRTAGQG